MRVPREQGITPMLPVACCDGVAPGYGNGNIRSIKIRIQHTEHAGDAFVFGAGNGGQNIGTTAIRKRMQQGNGTYIVIVRAHVAIENNRNRLLLSSTGVAEEYKSK